jgi:hypothetical protein
MKKYLLILVLFASCATQKKAEKYYSKHPEELAQVCIDKFPLDTISKTDTFYQKADNVDYSGIIDSIKDVFDNTISEAPTVVYDSNCIEEYNKLLSNQKALKDKITSLQANYKPCKPDTVRLTKQYTVEDKRKLFIVQNDLNKEKKAHNKTIIGKHIFMWWAIVATILLALVILINYFKIDIMGKDAIDA